MTERRIQITVDWERDDTWKLTATLSEPMLRGRSLVWRGMYTKTLTLTHPYANVLSRELLTEWTTALALVSAGWYENRELPFE